MLRWRGLEATPVDLGRTVVTVGMYDGVHRGHQKLIGEALARARATHRPCLLLTFDPHPAEVVRPGSHPAILTSMDRKAELVADLGVDAMCVLPFTPEFMRLAPETFACGTAAVITPVGEVKARTGDFVVGDGTPGPLTMKLRESLLDIQHGRVADTRGWLHRVA